MAMYNGQKNIIEQLDSLKNQTQVIDEVIIWDDCSTDDSWDIVYFYLVENHLQDKWILKKNKENVGWRKNFIDLLQVAKGELIFTCDQDDIWNLKKIEEMYSCFSENDKIDVLVSDYKELVEPGGLNEELKKVDTESLESYKSERVIFNENNLYIRRPGCVYAVRKKFIPKVIQYTETTKNPVHDQAMWGSGLLSDSLYLIRKPLIAWRKHGNSSFKKEIDFTEKNNPYIIRLNDLKRRYDRLMGALGFLEENPQVIDYKIKYSLLENTTKELIMRIHILENKKFSSIIGSIFKYKRKFYFFSDILHLFKHKITYHRMAQKVGN